MAVRITTDREVREPRVDMRMVNSTRAGIDGQCSERIGQCRRVFDDAVVADAPRRRGQRRHGADDQC
ncbi:hypothetical protein C6A85_13775, partial [Mycobacterium sp. ITM-2017-0098]